MIPRFLSFVCLLAAALASYGIAAASDNPQAAPCVVLVLDKSGSMEGERYERLSDAVTAALAILPDGAEVAVVVFDHEPKVLARTAKLNEKNRREFVKAVAAVKPEGGTDILAGTAEAIKLLSPKGGVILLLSDGLQTGSTGNTPWPRAKWEPPAKALSEQARKNGVVTHTIALGPDAEADELLKHLARSTGGEHWKIRKPDELLSRYVEIAAQLSSFWMRSEEGDFTLPSDEVVIQIVGKKAPPTLFKRDRGQPSPVSADVEFAGNRVRAERFLLAAGEYSFKPGKEGASTLLRPMKVRWKLPSETKLPAAREVEVTAQAVTAPDDGAALKDLVLSARIGDVISPLKATADDNGLFALKFKTPTKLQPLSVVCEATQRGWRYPVGRWSAELVTPPPVNISLKPRKAAPLDLVTSGSARTVEIEVEAETDTSAVPVDLTISTPAPGLEVQPQAMKLDGPRKFTVTIKRAGTAALPATCEGSLKFTVTSTDLVPPKVNGAATLTWDFSWTHLNPRLELRGLTRQDYTIRRGGAVVLPVEVTGADLGGKKSGVLLEKAECPKGVRAGLVVRDGEKVFAVPSLAGGANGAVEIGVDSSVAPGTYTVRLWFRSQDDSIPLNGTVGTSQLDLSVVVPEIEVELRLEQGVSRWVVIAPVADARREIVLEVLSRDGEALPELKVEATPTAPVRVTALGRTPISPSRLQCRFELLIPAQSRPFHGEVRFTVAAGKVEPGASASVAVVIPPVRVRATPVLIGATRYPDWAEAILGHVRPSPECSLKVEFEGTGGEGAVCSWVLVDERGGSGESRTPGEDGTIRFASVAGHVELRSRYAHTEFLPAARIPVNYEATVVPLPWWVWGVVATLGLLIGVLSLRPWPVKVLVYPDAVRWRLGRLPLDGLGNVAGLRLRLGRGLFGGLTATRHPKDGSGARVSVVSQAGEQTDLAPGESCPLGRGDLLVVRAAGVEAAHVEVLCGRTARTRTTDDGLTVSEEYPPI